MAILLALVKYTLDKFSLNPKRNNSEVFWKKKDGLNG